ncbi:MAG TPA: carbohydrate kinase family protein [Burkholderiaceae bacterium]|nr:carbohydrate kinase family protein [Burkholderiaceae bacterium]
MSTLICGSVAFDTIMVFKGRFKEHILPEQVHILSVSFLVPELRREFGGCAGNIAYNLRLLGEDPLPMATVGDDARPYFERFDALGIDRRHVQHVPGTYTAQAYITTDLDDNQIIAFHPGAMSQAHLNAVPGDGSVKLGIVAPDGRDGMLQHAQQFADLGLPFVFDPGQGLPMFNGEELQWFIARAHYVAVNDYEGRLLAERTGQSLEQLAGRVKALIVTRGGEGSTIHANGRTIEIPVVPPRQVLDPTGCGDAYRAGLLYGIEHGLDWDTTGRLAAVLGALKIEHAGAQNHIADRAQIGERFQKAFGYLPW